MKRLLIMGLSTAALAGCASPQYPVTRNYTPPPPIKPKYPISAPPVAAAPAAAPAARPAPDAAVNSAAQTSESPAAGASAAPTPSPVESAPLAPAAAPPQSAPSPSPAAAAPAPAPVVAPPAPKPVAPPTPAYTYVPPHRERHTVTRTETAGRVVRPRGMYRLYVVRDGDHLDSIARDLGVERADLVRVNRLHRPYVLQPGQQIKTPVARAYEAERGDTLAGVARRFGVSLGELAQINDLSEGAKLSAGMDIALPPGYHDHGPTRVTTIQEVWTPSRRVETYAPPRATPYESGPYQPSAEALEAGAARRAEMARQGSGAYTPPPARAAPEPARPSTETLSALGKGRFIWPVRGSIISNFGTTGDGRRNDGIDIAAPPGSPVRATAAGRVVYAGDQVPGFGNLVLIKHADGWVSAYAHLADISVHMRDDVYQGEQVGDVGETGGMSQPEVHFELRYAATAADKARPVDPVTLLPK